jgi:polyphosphate kinase
MSDTPAQFNPRHFFNRELSWLEFNQRVLDEARDPANPLLERVKFFTIVGSNLDEFFEVRVAGLKQQIESRAPVGTPDGLTAAEALNAVIQRVRKLVEEQYACWRTELQPGLAAHGFEFPHYDDLTAADRAWLEHYYRANVHPVLTPLGLDPAHPFPQLINKSQNLIVRLRVKLDGKPGERLAVVPIPAVLPRLVKLPSEKSQHRFLFLGRLIKHFLLELFPGAQVLGAWQFRVTRNSELYLDEGDIANLLKAVENEVHNRRKGAAVRLEVEAGCPADLSTMLLQQLGLDEDDLFVIDGPLSPGRIMMIVDASAPAKLLDAPFSGPVAAELRDQTDLFAALRERDVLLHHPFDSFGSVTDFLRQAADDPNVLAIKQTLYRTGGDPRIVGALMDAARNGKQVTAVVELRARFDEANNIVWARRMEEAGVHVTYGLVGYKIHGKMCLVVRHEAGAIRRYLHLGTGNYNPATAKLYTDLSLLTARAEICEDATNLFNLLTGVSQFHGTRKLIVAPFTLHERMLALIRRETENARKGLPARIIAKMNSLVDPHLIEALYEASQAGVKIDLIVRGICCLRPRVKGLSENISVRSIVGRFLEHSRIYYFENACAPEVFIGSADWMPRNFFRRIEVVFPIEDGRLRERIIHEVLRLNLADNVKARELGSDGFYTRAVRAEGTPAVSSQDEFMRLAVAAAKPASAAPQGKSKTRKFPKVKLAARPER